MGCLSFSNAPLEIKNLPKSVVVYIKIILMRTNIFNNFKEFHLNKLKDPVIFLQNELFLIMS